MGFDLGGLIAGALGGAAKATTEIADTQIQTNQKMDLARQLSDIEEQRTMRLDEVKRTRDISDIGKKAEADTAALEATGGRKAKALVNAKKEELEAEMSAGLPDLQAKLAASGYRANKPLEAEKAVDTGKNAAAGEVAKVKTPGYLGAVQSETNAKESSASKASAANSLTENEINKIKLANDKRTQELLWEYPKATPARQEQINSELSILNNKDVKRFTPVPIRDDMGTITDYKILDAVKGVYVDPNAVKAPPPAAGLKEGDLTTLPDGSQGVVIMLNNSLRGVPVSSPLNPANKKAASTKPAFVEPTKDQLKSQSELNKKALTNPTYKTNPIGVALS